MSLHFDAIVADCHNDLMRSVMRQGQLGEAGTFKHRWLPELRAGGVDVQVVPVFTDAEFPEAALRSALKQIATFRREVAANADEVAACGTGAEIQAVVAEGKIAMVLALEGAMALGSDPSLVAVFHALGVRMLSFTHMGRTHLADGSAENPTGSRLTRAGVEVLAEMERLGVLMDVSHLGVAGLEHVLEIATRPVIASHSSARALHDHHRNLTDEQLTAIAATGGVIGATMLPGFVDPTHPTVDRVVDHIAHMVKIAGPEHVGLGPDFILDVTEDINSPRLRMTVEGVDLRQTIPDLYGSRHMPAITEAMLRRGFTEAMVRGVLGLNFLRVFEQVMGAPRQVSN